MTVLMVNVRPEMLSLLQEMKHRAGDDNLNATIDRLLSKAIAAEEKKARKRK